MTHSRPSAAWTRAMTAVALVGVVALAVVAAAELWRISLAGRGLPLWDPAEHGLAGVGLAEALRRGDVIGFLLGVNRQTLWPFVHSLMLAPWVLVFGNDFSTTDRLSSVLYSGTVVTLCVAGLRLHPTRGAWVGCAAAALALLAPLYRVYGTLTMLEMPGALLLSLTACLHVLACREPAPRALLIAAGVSSSALFLCKYNYGLLWLLPLALHEGLALPAARRNALIERGLALARSRRWLRPFPVFMLAWLLVLVAIQATGGGVIELVGVRVSVRSPGNGGYVLYLLLIGWGVVRVRRAGGFRIHWQRLSGRHRILAATVVLPLAIWFLIPYPNRVGAFVGFVVNRDSGTPLWSWDTLLFYPRAFAADYSPTSIVGWSVLALALVPPLRPGSGRDPLTLLYLALWTGLLITAGHQYRQSRFLFTTAPIVWLLAARNGVELLARALDRPRWPGWMREPAWALVLAATLAAAHLAVPPRAAILAGHQALTSPPAFGPVLDRVLDQAARTQGRPTLLGYSNSMSPALARWYCLLTRPAQLEDQVPRNAVWLPARSPERVIADRIEVFRRAGRSVISALPDASFPGDSRDYREEIWADSVTVVRLRADPRVMTELDDVVPASGFRISTFRFVEPRAPHPPRP